jgi:hypothetical protein
MEGVRGRSRAGNPKRKRADQETDHLYGLPEVVGETIGEGRQNAEKSTG